MKWVWTRNNSPCDAYRVVWHFQGKVVGSAPLDPSFVRPALEAAGLQPPKLGPLVDLTDKEGAPSWAIEPPELLRIVTGFEVWKGLLTLRADTIKAHLADCALQLWVARQVTSRAFWALVGNSVYVLPYRIPLRKGNDFVTKADGWHERVTRIVTPRGFCYVQMLSQYIEGASIEFNVLVQKSRIEEDDLNKLLVLAGFTATAAGGPWGEVDVPMNFNISVPPRMLRIRSLS